MHRYTLAKWLNAAQFITFLSCLLILYLLVASGIYTPQGRNGDFFGIDLLLSAGLMLLGFWLYFNAPVWLLRRKGLSDRKIYRLQQISTLAVTGWIGSRLVAWLYVAFILGTLLSIVGLTTLSAKFFPNNTWLSIMQNDFYRAFIVAACPTMFCQTLIGHIALSRIRKKRLTRAGRPTK